MFVLHLLAAIFLLWQDRQDKMICWTSRNSLMCNAQVVEGKLPRPYEYHKAPAPFIQVPDFSC